MDFWGFCLINGLLQDEKPSLKNEILDLTGWKLCSFVLDFWKLSSGG